jgi:uncharacterized membrane protein YqaE (UPF0057 family)
MAFTCSDVIKIIFAIILPPLGVFLERGCSADLLINILLTILGYIPGIIHALYVLNSIHYACAFYRPGPCACASDKKNANDLMLGTSSSSTRLKLSLQLLQLVYNVQHQLHPVHV